MRNKLTDLNNFLFAQLERLDDETLSAEELEAEISRSKAIGQISAQIIQNASVQLRAVEVVQEYGISGEALNNLIGTSESGT